MSVSVIIIDVTLDGSNIELIYRISNDFDLYTGSFRQEWYTDISENKKLQTYKTFKSSLEPEIFLTSITSFFSKKRVIKILKINPQLNDRGR